MHPLIEGRGWMLSALLRRPNRVFATRTSIECRIHYDACSPRVVRLLALFQLNSISIQILLNSTVVECFMGFVEVIPPRVVRHLAKRRGQLRKRPADTERNDDEGKLYLPSQDVGGCPGGPGPGRIPRR